jgi:parallel beta-helix repeat protein
MLALGFNGVEMKRTAIALILTLLLLLVAGTLLVNLSSANFFPDPGPDLPRIYIRNDGNVEPTTAPIERTGNLYQLTGNVVLYTIEIQRDNIILDGAGYTIQGNASRIKGYDDGNNGIIVTGRNNLVITRFNFEEGDTGIRISGSSNISVIDNSFSMGICTGIEVKDSTQILIETNVFTDLQTDISVPSVRLNGSKNTFRNNTLTGNAYGVEITGSSNVITDNKIEIASQSVRLGAADSNIIARNKITGDLSLVGCSNNIILGNNLTGVRMLLGSNNTFFGNHMVNNLSLGAIEFTEWAVNNTFYGNNFSAGSKVRFNDAGPIFWDNGTIGNYWEDYNETDNNGDGIGDSLYIITGVKWDNDIGGDVSFAADQDNYPLMTPFEIPLTPTPSPEPQQEPELFPTAVVAAASGVFATAIGIGLIVYFKKRKH